MATLRDWGPADDAALDRWLTRSDLDEREFEDCLAGVEDPDARPCGECAACKFHAAEMAHDEDNDR